LFCGRSFCSLHRGELGGAHACAECLQTEHARKKAALVKREQREAKRTAGKARRDGVPLPEPDAPPAPLPEPPAMGPVAWGLVAALPTALYLWFFLGWLLPRHDMASWIQPAGALVGTAAAFCGVWAIVKTRQGRTH
jgi:hypothetical protein